MADNQTKSGAFLSWVGGIAATVIAGVLIYHFTAAKPTPPPTPATQIGLNGFVEDSVTQKPIVDAIVTANLGAKLASQPTDSEGRYAFIMDSTTPPAQSINVDVLSGGYEHYAATVPLTGGDTFAGLQLQPIQTAPALLPGQIAVPHPGIDAAPLKVPPKQALILHAPKNYNKRAEIAALKPK
ncbi:MAG: hypothetical protein WB439_03585 [Acidobacteriaceae bacterium]